MRFLSTILALFGFAAVAAAQPSFSGWDTVMFDPADANKVKVPTDALRYTDDFAVEYGTNADFIWRFDGTNSQLELFSAGASDNVVYIPQGSTNFHFSGHAYLDNETASQPAYVNSNNRVVSQLLGGGDITDGSIANVDLANASVTYTAGTGLSGGGTVALGSSATINLVTPVALGNGGTGTSLSDPGGDFIMFWDDGATAVNWLNISTGLTLTDTNLTANLGDTVENSELANDSITINTPESGLEGGGTVALGNSLSLTNVLGSTIENSELANTTVSYGGESVALGGSDATPAFDLLDATNAPPALLKEDDGETLADGDVAVVDQTNGEWDFNNLVEEAQDAWDSLQSGGTHSLISYNYDDAGDSFSATVQNDLSQYDNSTSQFFDTRGTGIGGTGTTVTADLGSSVEAGEVSGLTAGELLFGASGGGLAQSSQAFWDDTNNELRLGGTATPDDTLDVQSGSVQIDSLTADRVVVSDGNGSLVSTSTSTNQIDILPRAVAGRLPRNGLHWNGTDNTPVQVSNDASFRGTFLDGGTARVVFNRVSQDSNRQNLLHKDDDWFLNVLASSDTLEFRHIFTTQSGVWEVTNVTLNEIKDVVIVYDTSDTANDPTIYINGVSQTVTETQAPSGTAADNGLVFEIGDRADFGNRPFTGDIYHASLLNYAVTASDVAEVYETGWWPYRISKGTQVNQLSSPSAFDSADWGKSNVSITDTNTTDTADPDGGNQADTVTENNDTDQFHHVEQGSIGVELGRAWRVEVSAKPNGRNWIGMRLADGQRAWFDINNGATGQSDGDVLSHSIEDQGNGWFRCTAVILANNPNDNIEIFLSDADGSNSYDGDGTSGVYLYNAVAKPVGVTAGYRLDEGIGHQVHDTSGNENHGVWNQTSGIEWIREKRQGYVEVFGRTANSELLSGIDTLPANAIITDAVVEETAGGDPVDTYLSTAQGDTSTKISVPEDLAANGLVSPGIVDTMPGGNATQNLHINEDGTWAGTLRVWLAYKTHRGR